MKPGKALSSGVAGAAALTLIHESLKKILPQAPRMDLLGMQAIQKLMNKTGEPLPQQGDSLYTQALAGDLLTNSIYYSLAAVGNNPWTTGLLAGLGAGIAAVTLPKQLGLDEEHTNRSAATTAMTIGIYTLGGLAAAAVASLLKGKSEDENELNIKGLDIREKRSWNLKD